MPPARAARAYDKQEHSSDGHQGTGEGAFWAGIASSVLAVASECCSSSPGLPPTSRSTAGAKRRGSWACVSSVRRLPLNKHARFETTVLYSQASSCSLDN